MLNTMTKKNIVSDKKMYLFKTMENVNDEKYSVKLSLFMLYLVPSAKKTLALLRENAKKRKNNK